MGVSFSSKGDWSKTTNFLHRAKKFTIEDLDKYGQEGVRRLTEYTPKDTGLTSQSWYYEIVQTDDGITIRWNNSNVKKDYCNIAVILQYGHATGTGGYVEGIDYINPALAPIFQDIADRAWKVVSAE